MHQRFCGVDEPLPRAERLHRRCLCCGCFPGFEEIIYWLAFDDVMDQILRQNGLKFLHLKSQAEVSAEDQSFQIPVWVCYPERSDTCPGRRCRGGSVLIIRDSSVA